jgi:hypothetical protein
MKKKDDSIIKLIVDNAETDIAPAIPKRRWRWNLPTFTQEI